MKMGVLDWIAMVLVVIGGINWGLVGIFSLNVVSLVAGEGIIAKIIYIIVGIAALYMIIAALLKKEPTVA
jgi:hypothetical protein